MKALTLHVINHTHWDREWFVPYTFTRQWIPDLILNLYKITQNNPSYKYLLDAQTLIMDDLKYINLSVYKIAKNLIKSKNLEIGPYYAQIDQKLSSGESFYKNLIIGIEQSRKLKASENFTAWNVDLFGHISQSPQIHNTFNIKTAYIWRGIPELKPFFRWKSPNGDQLLVVNLFAGGYRNFYNITKLKDIALTRLNNEINKLQKYYPHKHIPLFDGYDLDKNPEDPVSFFNTTYKNFLSKHNYTILQSSPYEYAKTISFNVPEVEKSELISGKYASVFPGTLSTRTYSKIQSHNIEQLLYRYVCPLSTIIPLKIQDEEYIKAQTKELLQNLVHDVIAGCSIDQVHLIAEKRIQILKKNLYDIINNSLSVLSSTLTSGIYAFTPGLGKYSHSVYHNNFIYEINPTGVGIIKISKVFKLKIHNYKVKTFQFSNAFYDVVVNSKGIIDDKGNILGTLVFREEFGDAYWDSPFGKAYKFKQTDPITVLHQTDTFARITYKCVFNSKGHNIKAKVTITFDNSPIIKYKVLLDNKGKNYSVLLRTKYKSKIGSINAGMPFDTVNRPFEDKNLLNRNLKGPISSILIGQRDIGKIYTYPFHSYVVPEYNNLKKNNITILAKGIKAYQTNNNNIIDIVLSRAIDWVSKPEPHLYHTGDAGPNFYVPQARAQRKTTIECGYYFNTKDIQSIEFHRNVDNYITPPIIFYVDNLDGDRENLFLFNENSSLSTIEKINGKTIARIYNPTNYPVHLNKKYICTDPFGNKIGNISHLKSKQIATIELQNHEIKISQKLNTYVKLISAPNYHVCKDISQPEKSQIQKLLKTYNNHNKNLDHLYTLINKDSKVSNKLIHKYYITARECMEAKLSYEWNKNNENITTINEELYNLSLKYNDLRILRRMYDYIANIDEKSHPILTLIE